jgi:hypothetical protein
MRSIEASPIACRSPIELGNILAIATAMYALGAGSHDALTV